MELIAELGDMFQTRTGSSSKPAFVKRLPRRYKTFIRGPISEEDAEYDL